MIMGSSAIPPTIYVAIGALLAALITGFFSFLNLVSAKENKVSEFRLSWVDGLREEIASYTAAVQELVRIGRFHPDLSKDDPSDESSDERVLSWIKESKDAYDKAIENLTKIHLRLNPKHVHEHPNSPEAALMKTLQDGRDKFNEGDFNGAFDSCEAIREAAAPLLKSTWDLVKHGEPGYLNIRRRAIQIIVGGLILVMAASGVAVITAIGVNANTPSKPTWSCSAA
ncbi:hypothetical protein [Pseudogulbenkiania sp. MAI-1]|uniref:hypothetical protein n=1 Tax=Pseudogulbenkiania sp. MAI-1 TaxID=990370 RepID=UPI0012EB748B|nr:hypothetical protein [Pseudogulbenkiania sp. MAI-1]